MTDIQEKTVHTGEVQTHYWEAGAGRPMVLLHGGGAGADAWGNWNKVINQFVEKGFHVYAYDAIGFGETEKPDPNSFSYSQEARVNQAIQFIDQLGIDKPVLVGNSMGGLTSLGVAIRKPEKISELILMGVGKPKADSSGFKSLLNYDIGKDYMYKIVRNLTNEDFEVSEDMVDYRLRLTQKPGAMEAYNAIMEGIVAFEFDDEDLKNIKNKAFLVHGKADQMVPKERSYHLLETLENTWMYVMPHCGHWAMIEYPEEFVRVTSDFLQYH
ncbi:Pimeloyl-ACP methyl ester carboxylesterase [Alteribacillus persepolensis]|uniref:Pimeloyl-ACP methyl ester carboxylesterase n=1 Tax=Alteribacillus persepolensis TaxID=568899 RepID=A0A1G8EED7_9BACI|nr:alpha/beta hydrolase [Alteribacillus persepolensis]SDH68069.1 Pimeloyl-ACP methyl ester carboxylesterase [Alteribacillus persepolensis]